MTSLKEWSEWYLGDALSLKLRCAGTNEVRATEHFSELVIYREPPFQAVIMTLFPGHQIPSHYHPNVDSYDLNLTGDGVAYVAGFAWTKKVQDKPRLDLRIPVLAGTVHYGFTPNGSGFLSLQKWLNNIQPTFLSEDWVDTPCQSDVVRRS